MSKSISSIKGIVPFYKEAGISSHTIIQWFQLHIAYEFPIRKMDWYIPHVDYYRAIEPFVSGVITIAIGRPSLYIKYLKFCDCHYTLDLRMGQSTITDYYQSPTIDSKPYDHIKLDDIKNACQSFIGPQIQMLPKVHFLRPLGIQADENNTCYDEITSWEKFMSIENQMRYKTITDHAHHRKVTCHSIEVTKFDPPNLTLEVNCDVPFSIRTFSKELFAKLNTCGSFEKVQRSREGPFTIEDCLDRTELYLKYLEPALRKHTSKFVDHVRPHLDKLTFYDDLRLGRQR